MDHQLDRFSGCNVILDRHSYGAGDGMPHCLEALITLYRWVARENMRECGMQAGIPADGKLRRTALKEFVHHFTYMLFELE
mmetsp:Transcript_3290/g.3693  ORF Transcript_3290/g.3693 Transcript_3290/m.3693 type:complete len:81 (+) Transcript_3290:667-909(+)